MEEGSYREATFGTANERGGSELGFDAVFVKYLVGTFGEYAAEYLGSDVH